MEEITIDPKDIFTVTKDGYVLLGKEPITADEVASLQEEIKFLEKTRIWAIMSAGVGERARQIMFEKSKTFEDMRVGKAMLYCMEMLRNTMVQIKSIKTKKK